MVNLKQLAHLSSAACSQSICLLLLLLPHSTKGHERSLPSQMALRVQTEREWGGQENGGRGGRRKEDREEENMVGRKEGVEGKKLKSEE